MGLPHFDPPDDEIAAPFWAAIQDEHIVLPRCRECGRWSWYPDDAGARCHDAPLRWEAVATTGTVHTATRVERAFLPRGQADVPFTVGFVELDGVDGVRLVANLADDERIAIGSRVKASFVPFGHRRHLVFVAET
jgi:uncharacterized OB-fold protein